MKTLAPIGIFTIALLGLTACDDGPGGEVTESENNGTEETAEETSEDAEEDQDEDADESDASSDRPTFGDTWTYDDGLAVTISEPESFEPGEWASGGENFDEHVMFTVTIANGTGEDFDPDLVSLTAHSSGGEGDSVFDSEIGLEGPPTTTLLDGQDTSFQFGFGVNDPNDITVEFTDLDFEIMRDSVIFVSP